MHGMYLGMVLAWQTQQLRSTAMVFPDKAERGSCSFTGASTVHSSL